MHVCVQGTSKRVGRLGGVSKGQVWPKEVREAADCVGCYSLDFTLEQWETFQ